MWSGGEDAASTDQDHDDRHGVADLQCHAAGGDDGLEGKVIAQHDQACIGKRSMLETHLPLAMADGLAEKSGAGLTDDQVNDQDCDHASQWNMESRADVCKVLGVWECFVSSHTPSKSRAGIVRPDDDEEVQAHHDEGTEDTSTDYRARHFHPPIHIWLRCYHDGEQRQKNGNETT